MCVQSSVATHPLSLRMHTAFAPPHPPAAVASFVHRQLKVDPKLKPEDIEVTTDHLDRCLSCENARLHHRSVHRHDDSSRPHRAQQPWAHFGTEVQTFADDFAIDNYRAMVRILMPPVAREVALRPSPKGDVRFGCPCSAVPANRTKGVSVTASPGEGAALRSEHDASMTQSSPPAPHSQGYGPLDSMCRSSTERGGCEW